MNDAHDVKDGALQIFDVDHGACALLTMPTGQRVLIDCGHATNFNGSPWYPGRHLASLGIKHVDLFFCTNYDEDHASGFPDLLQQGITIGCILGNPTVSPETIAHLKTADGMGPGINALTNHLAARRFVGLAEKPPTIPGVVLRWFWNPWPRWDAENNLSLAAHLSVHGTNFLFPGDLETDGFRNMLGNGIFAGLMPGLHVLVAAHHGRESGKCPLMFDDHGCRPQLVIISDCAKKFQSQETVPYYQSKARGVPNVRSWGTWRYVMTTRADGEIVFRWENAQCYVY